MNRRDMGKGAAVGWKAGIITSSGLSNYFTAILAGRAAEEIIMGEIRGGGGRQGYTAARSVEQPNANPLLKAAERMAQLRGANAERKPGTPEVSMLGDLQEVREVREVGSTKLHRKTAPFRKQLQRQAVRICARGIRNH